MRLNAARFAPCQLRSTLYQISDENLCRRHCAPTGPAS